MWVRITGDNMTKTLKFSRCAGGEVRFDISLDMTRRDGYLDGYLSGPIGEYFYTRPTVGDTGTVTMKVNDTEEGATPPARRSGSTASRSTSRTQRGVVLRTGVKVRDDPRRCGHRGSGACGP